MKVIKPILFFIILAAITNNIQSYPYRTCIFPNIFIFGDVHTNSKEEEKSVEDLKKILELSNSEKLTILVESGYKNLFSVLTSTKALDFIFAQTYISEPPKFITSKYLIQAATELKTECSRHYFKLNPEKIPLEFKHLNQNSTDLFLSILGKNNEWLKKFNIIEIDNLRGSFWVINHCLEDLQHFCLISLYYPSLLTDNSIKIFVKKLNEFCPSFNQIKININEYKQSLNNLRNNLSKNIDLDQNITNHINQISNLLDDRFLDLTVKISNNMYFLSLLNNEKNTINWMDKPLTEIFEKTFYVLQSLLMSDDYRFLETFFQILSYTRLSFDYYLNYEVDKSRRGFLNEIDNSLDYIALEILIDPKYSDNKFLVFVGNEHLLNLRDLLIKIKGSPLLEFFKSKSSKENLVSDNYLENVPDIYTNHSKYFPLILKTKKEIAEISFGQAELTKFFQPHSFISGIIHQYVQTLHN